MTKVKYDFSTREKREEFIKNIQGQSSNHWSDPLPNLQWLSEEEFAKSGFFMWNHEWTIHNSMGGPNKTDNHAQLPNGYEKPEWTTYGRVFVMHDMTGFILLNAYHQGRVWFGKFAFCKHKHTDSKNLGRCWNKYTCRDCGFSWEVDSSD